MHQKINPLETILFMDNSCPKSKKVLAYAKSRNSNLLVKDWNKDRFTTTMWKELLVKLNKSPKDLMDKSLPYYQENIRGKNFNEEDWLNILAKSPFLLRGPIVIEGKNAMLCDNASHIFKF